MARSRSKRALVGGSKSSQNEDRRHDDRESESEVESVDLEKSDDELELDRLVLGDSTPFNSLIRADKTGQEALDVGDSDTEDNALANVADADLFFLDDMPAATAANALVEQQSDEEEVDNAPAWEDSDDDRLAISLADNSRLRKLRTHEGEDMVSGREYTRRLRRQFLKLHPAPDWATYAQRPAKRRRRSSVDSNSSRDSDEMSVDEEDHSTLPLARLLQDANALAKTSSSTKRKLRPEVLDIQRTRGIADTQPSSVTSLSFHPQFPVILSSGPASTLYLHHIAPDAHPTPNPLLTSVHIRSVPITTSAFLGPEGKKIFFSGKRRYFHTWDLETGSVQKVTRVYGQKEEQKLMGLFKLSPCGRYMGLIGTAKKGGGIINILDANTCQWIAAARLESRGGIADFAWWRDSSGMTIAGKSGEVGEWSLQTRAFIGHWHDDGAINTTVIALGGHSKHSTLGGDRWVVVGGASGVVNIYDRRAWSAKSLPKRPEPTRAFMQLTTETTSVAFSPDGQLLAFGSKHKRDALRLVHLPSCTVFRNWPTSQTPLGKVTAVTFDKESELLAIGNEAGKIRLWEIRA